jgi:hypothetical protein
MSNAGEASSHKQLEEWLETEFLDIRAMAERIAARAVAAKTFLAAKRGDKGLDRAEAEAPMQTAQAIHANDYDATAGQSFRPREPGAVRDTGLQFWQKKKQFLLEERAVLWEAARIFRERRALMEAIRNLIKENRQLEEENEQLALEVQSLVKEVSVEFFPVKTAPEVLPVIVNPEMGVQAVSE